MKTTSLKKFGFYFSELLITTIAYSFLIWYFASKEYIFSSYNREISWLIVVLFGIGILMVAGHLLNLYREDQQITTAQQRFTLFKTAASRLNQRRQDFSAEMFANHFRKTVDEHFAMLEPSLIKTRVYRIVNMALSSAESLRQETLSHLLQQQEQIKGTRVRYIAGILIMIGLLGTFLGLVQAIKYLQHFFTATESVDVTTLFSDMKQTLGGLDKAFGTSIGGITAYLVLGYLNIVLRAKQSHIFTRIEDITLEHFMPVLRNLRAEPSQGVPSELIDVLRTIPGTLSTQVATGLEETMVKIMGESFDNLRATSATLQQTGEQLQQGQGLLSETVTSFGSFLAAFQESKDQLLVSQDAIVSGVNEFSQALLNFQENQQMLTSNLDLTRSYIEHSESRLETMSTIVQQFQQLWAENRQVFAMLAETIQKDHGTLSQTTQHLEEFLAVMRTDSQQYFEHAQEGISTLTQENSNVLRDLLEAHTLLTTLVHEMKNFLLDEQNGLRLLSTSMGETFGEARFQYLQLTDHLEALHKRMHEHQEQLAQVQEGTASIHKQLQSRHGA